MKFYEARWYEKWMPVIARVIFGLQFLMGAAFKIPGTQGFVMEAGQTAAAGVPLATVAVFLAFLLELVLGLMLVFGYRVRLAAAILAPYVLLLALIFYHNLGDMMTMGMFVSHLAMIAGLLYVSVYGAQHVALKKDSMPTA